jgi:hypothetical protein
MLLTVICDVYFLRTLSTTDKDFATTKNVSFLVVPVKQDEICLVVSVTKTKMYLLTKENIVAYTNITKNSKSRFEVFIDILE